MSAVYGTVVVIPVKGTEAWAILCFLKTECLKLCLFIISFFQLPLDSDICIHLICLLLVVYTNSLVIAILTESDS